MNCLTSRYETALKHELGSSGIYATRDPKVSRLSR